MSGGGTKTYKHPLISWGGRMRSASNSERESKWLNYYHIR